MAENQNKDINEVENEETAEEVKETTEAEATEEAKETTETTEETETAEETEASEGDEEKKGFFKKKEKKSNTPPSLKCLLAASLQPPKCAISVSSTLVTIHLPSAESSVIVLPFDSVAYFSRIALLDGL